MKPGYTIFQYSIETPLKVGDRIFCKNNKTSNSVRFTRANIFPTRTIAVFKITKIKVNEEV